MNTSNYRNSQQLRRISKILALAGGIVLFIMTIGPFILVFLNAIFADRNRSSSYRPYIFTFNMATFFALPLGILGIAAIRSIWQVENKPIRAGIAQLIAGLAALFFVLFDRLFLVPGTLLILASILTFISSSGASNPGYQRSNLYSPLYQTYPTVSAPFATPAAMDMADLPTFYKAVSMAQAGNKAAAYQQFKSLEMRNLNNIDVLLWVAYTAPTLLEAEVQITRASALAPNEPGVLQARQWLAREKASGRI
jgi:hypothetical protein